MVLLVKKFVLLVAGVAITHFGVALSMIPDIGIGAYDAFGLTISYVSGVDVSIIYAAMSGVFLLGQILIERRSFRLTELFQLVFVFGSGFFTAIFTRWVFDGVTLGSYAAKIFVLAAAIVCKAVGLITIIESYLIRVPMEGFCVCIADRTPFSMGKVRMAFDVLFVVLIAIITPIADLPWTIREGTAIAFVIHGPMLDILQKPTRRLFGRIGIYPPYMAKDAARVYVREKAKSDYQPTAS
ncbi:MAG TPA: hypothetical protein IAD51_05320 [Candidatus Limadaptatus stercorigallinarum]|uniref:Uncharacterized protein n=1 Tax=Candidatus Limadaptatus stercorigallinarum TaxID=2840845 RepID=A0A9D1HUT3_9FIRM|nr:hypothetical protein [Candidatus Limadaptatus stercorigallinarum]